MSVITPKAHRKYVLALKTESVLGTAESSLTSSNAGFRLSARPNLRIVATAIEREAIGAYGSANNMVGRKSTTLAVPWHLAGNGTSGSPDAGALGRLILPASGFDDDGDGTYTVSNSTSDWKTLTAHLYRDGLIRKARGLMFNTVFTFTAGNPVQCQSDGTGGWIETPGDEAILTGMSYDAVTPPNWSGSGACIIESSSDYPVDQVAIDVGNQVVLRLDGNSPGGVLCGWIENRDIRVTVAPEIGAASARNWSALHEAQTEVSMTLVVGATAGNIATFTLGGLTPMESPDDEERAGNIVNPLTFNATSLSIAFS